MQDLTTHNPDRFMVDLRQILSQGRKRIGLLIGAGAAVAVRVNANNELDNEGKPLIPDVAGITKTVVNNLDKDDKDIINNLVFETGEYPNIEEILSRIRRISQAIGKEVIKDLTGEEYGRLADRICHHIGKIVAVPLPKERNPFTELVSWVGGINRKYPIEIFTPNYDLLLEEAFERYKLPYFDGFSGACRPFFDSASIADDLLPPRWSRLWKIHGSLGWEVDSENTIVRTGSGSATELIYPIDQKYDQISRQPYSALFKRLQEFLSTPDSLFICTGFSFSDAHITAVLDEALSANKHTAIFAFQYGSLEEEISAVKLAIHRPNMSVYARDGAVICGVQGKWRLGRPPTDEWERIRSTFWRFGSEDSSSEFLLGDFAKLARFFALSGATDILSESAPIETAENGNSGKVVVETARPTGEESA